MFERRFSKSPPRWAREASLLLDEVPFTGTQPEYAPRLPTRILPRSGGHSLTSQTLGDVILTTQKILNYVTCDVVYGTSLDFSDLRRVEADVLNLGKLHVEPFEEGSFVIPAVLSEEDVEVEVGGVKNAYTGRQVLDRFASIMMEFSGNNSSVHASIGLIQSIEDLGQILRREADIIEYRPTSKAGAAQPIVVNKEYVDRVKAIRIQRHAPSKTMQVLAGRLTAIDVMTGKLKLQMSEKRTVRGTFIPLIRDRLIELLNKRVKLTGIVESSGKRPTSIQAIDCEAVEE